MLDLHIPNFNASSNIHRKPETFFLCMSEKRILKIFWSLSGPTPSLLSICEFMWWSAWQGSQSTVVLQKTKNIRKVLFWNFRLHESRMSIVIEQTAHLDHASPWAKWRKEEGIIRRQKFKYDKYQHQQQHKSKHVYRRKPSSILCSIGRSMILLWQTRSQIPCVSVKRQTQIGMAYYQSEGSRSSQFLECSGKRQFWASTATQMVR